MTDRIKPDLSGTVTFPPMDIHQAALVITALSLVNCQLMGEIENALQALLIARDHHQQIENGNDWLDALCAAMNNRWPGTIEHINPGPERSPFSPSTNAIVS